MIKIWCILLITIVMVVVMYGIILFFTWLCDKDRKGGYFPMIK